MRPAKGRAVTVVRIVIERRGARRNPKSGARQGIMYEAGLAGGEGCCFVRRVVGPFQDGGQFRRGSVGHFHNHTRGVGLWSKRNLGGFVRLDRLVNHGRRVSSHVRMVRLIRALRSLPALPRP